MTNIKHQLVMWPYVQKTPNSNKPTNRHRQNMPTSLQKTRRSLNEQRKETVPMYQAEADE